MKLEKYIDQLSMKLEQHLLMKQGMKLEQQLLINRTTTIGNEVRTTTIDQQ